MGDDEGKRSARREYTSYCGGGIGEHRRNRSSANKGGRRRRRPAITSRRGSQVYCGGDGVAVGRGGGGGNDAHTGPCRRRHRALDGAASRRPNEAAAAVIPRRPGSAHDPKAPVCVLPVSITEPCTHRSANCTLCDCRPDRPRVYVVIKLKIIILSRVSRSFRIVFSRDLLSFRENRMGKIESKKKINPTN